MKPIVVFQQAESCGIARRQGPRTATWAGTAAFGLADVGSSPEDLEVDAAELDAQRTLNCSIGLGTSWCALEL